MAKKVMIMDTILRDAHQSHAATRMRTEQMIPVLEQLDEIGYYSLEGWRSEERRVGKECCETRILGSA